MPRYYLLEFLGESEAAVADFPDEVLPAYQSMLGLLVRSPWTSHGVYSANADDPVRFVVLVASTLSAFLYFYIDEPAKTVRVYQVDWVHHG